MSRSQAELLTTILAAYLVNNVARYNNVTVTGGTIKGFAAGGMSESNAIENKVMISGGNIGGYVCGAESRDGSATGNEVIISGTPTFESAHGTNIYGASTLDGNITGEQVDQRQTGF
ncbi:MAG: hypothetical protein ACLR2G_05225 [Phascolarctobacterium faecium]